MKFVRSVVLAVFAVVVLSQQDCFAIKKLYGAVDQWAVLCNAAGIKLAADGRIDKVMLGTPAYYSGLRNNDKVVNCNVGDNALKITFERAGKKYAVTVATDPSAVQPKSAPQKPPPCCGGAATEAQALKTLKEYDVIVFLDCSGSMNDEIRSENVRKWAWARENIKDFSSKYNQVVHRPITLVLFNDHFSIIPNCTMKDLEQVFDKRQPEGGTDLAEPLSRIIDDHLRRVEKRPCVIAVLHDGISDNEERVQATLEKLAADVFSPGKIHVTFIQIGDDIAGAAAMRNYANVNSGGEEVVNSRLFDQVKSEGLTRAIADAITKTVAPKKAAPGGAGILPTAKQGIQRTVPSKRH